MFVPARQLQDQLVRPDQLGGGNDARVDGRGVLIQFGGKAADVFLDRPLDQARVLRQVADMGGKPFGIPVVRSGAIDADRAPVGQQGTGERAQQCGLFLAHGCLPLSSGPMIAPSRLSLSMVSCSMRSAPAGAGSSVRLAVAPV